MGIGDIETHTDRPRYFWGIGSRLGHPSKYQNRPRTCRNHITAPPDDGPHAQYIHMGEIYIASTGAPKNKTRMVKGANGMVLAWGGVLLECILSTRDPHSPSCGHFHSHFKKRPFLRNTRTRNKASGGEAKQWHWRWGEDKTSPPTRR